MTDKTLAPCGSDSSTELGKLPAVARLYYTGLERRYKRASVQSGPGEPLCFVSLAEQRIRQAVAIERAKWEDLADEYNRLIRHMDAGGNFTEFQVAEARRRFGE